MTLEQISWLLKAADLRPVSNLDEAENKGACLIELSNEIRKMLAASAAADSSD